MGEGKPAYSIAVPGLASRLALSDEAEFHAFLVREREEWLKYNARVSGAKRVPKAAKVISEKHAAAWETRLGLFERLRSGEKPADIASDGNPLTGLAQAIEELLHLDSGDGRLLCSLSPLGQCVIDASTNDTPASAVALWAHVAHVQHAPFVGNIQPFLSRMIAALVTADGASIAGKASNAAMQAEGFRDSAQAAAERLQEMVGEHTGAHSTAVANADKELLAELDRMRAEFNKLKMGFQSEMQLGAPMSFWSGRAAEHKKGARDWGLVFGMFALLTGVVMYQVLGAVGAELAAAKPGSLEWVPPALSIGATVFVGIWILRIAARQVGEHLTREQDARERVVMVQTFLALVVSKDAPSVLATEPQLALVLTSLFRPGPGFAGDDSPPANLLEAVSRLSPSKNP